MSQNDLEVALCHRSRYVEVKYCRSTEFREYAEIDSCQGNAIRAGLIIKRQSWKSTRSRPSVRRIRKVCMIVQYFRMIRPNIIS